MNKIDLLITGVGGQGNILASDIIGEVAIDAGYDVKKTDTLGMAQRGGAVISNVRIARHVYSPLIRKAEADILLAFEKLEAVRWGNYLREGGIAIINNQAVPPLSVSMGNEQYPSDKRITDILKQRTDYIYFVEGIRCARELGNIATLNMFMLGCVSLFLPFRVRNWKASISQHLPAAVQKVNFTAFDQGRKAMRSVRI